MTFKNSIIDPEHYVNALIDHWSKATDAAPDVHEAYALLQLSCACSNLRWKFNPAMSGSDRLNLYFVYLGDSGDARKSTVMKMCRDLLSDALGSPTFFDGDTFTPQGLRDGLEEREGVPTIVHFDEMEDIFRAMASPGSNLGQLPMMLKSLYSSPRFVTKLSKIGKKMSEREIRIENSYLCLMGNVTPTVGNAMHQRYLTDGLIARINIIHNEDPVQQVSAAEWHERYAVYGGQLLTDRDATEAMLVDHLRGIYQVTKYLDDDARVVVFSKECLRTLKAFDDKINLLKQKSSEFGRPSLERIKMSTMKVAALVAAGRLGAEGIRDLNGVVVSEDDARDAIRFGNKLIRNSRLFVELCSDHDETLNAKRILNQVKRMAKSHGNRVASRPLTRALRNHMRVKDFDEAVRVLLASNEIVAHLGTGEIYYSLPTLEPLVGEAPASEDDSDPEDAKLN